MASIREVLDALIPRQRERVAKRRPSAVKVERLAQSYRGAMAVCKKVLAFRSGRSWRRRVSTGYVSFVLFVVVVLGGAYCLVQVLWPNGLGAGDEPLSVVVRNLLLGIGGVLALGLGMWRAVSAKRQADTASAQAETAQRQLSDERFQRAVELLSGDREEVKAAAVYALGHIAAEDHDRYADQVKTIIMGIFDAEVRPKAVGGGEVSRLDRVVAQVLKDLRGRKA